MTTFIFSHFLLHLSVTHKKTPVTFQPEINENFEEDVDQLSDISEPINVDPINFEDSSSNSVHEKFELEHGSDVLELHEMEFDSSSESWV